MSSNEARKAEWKKLIQEQKTSKLSKAEFCKQKGIKPARFYYHEGELRRNKDKVLKETTSFIPIAIKNPVLPANKNTTDYKLIRFILKNGIECLVPEGINKVYLKEIIEVLQRC